MKGREERNRHTKQQQQQQQLANQTANSKTEPNDKLGKMLQNCLLSVGQLLGERKIKD